MRTDTFSDADLLRCIDSEFREMPGLKLTTAQAARLFGLDRPRCEEVLGGLVHNGALSEIRGVFARADSGRQSI